MDERMTLEQVRDWLAKEGKFRIRVQGKNEHDNNLLKMADAIDAHLAQSAKAVDVGAIREVIELLEVFPSTTNKNMADKLTRAIGNTYDNE